MDQADSAPPAERGYRTRIAANRACDASPAADGCIGTPQRTQWANVHRNAGDGELVDKRAVVRQDGERLVLRTI
jgi:hypothetical protein